MEDNVLQLDYATADDWYLVGPIGQDVKIRQRLSSAVMHFACMTALSILSNVSFQGYLFLSSAPTAVLHRPRGLVFHSQLVLTKPSYPYTAGLSENVIASENSLSLTPALLGST